MHDAPSPAESPDESPPDERPRATSVAAVIVAILGVVYTMYFARAILLPIVFSFVMALVLRPLVRSLGRRGIPDLLGSLIVVSGVVGLIVWCGSLVVQPARIWLATMPQQIVEVQYKLKSVRDSIAGITEASNQLDEMTQPKNGKRPVTVILEQPSLNNSLVGRTGEFLGSAAISTVLVFFLLARFEALTEAMVSFLDVRERRDRVRAGILRVEQGISRYLFTVSLINVCLGIVTGTALAVLGLKNAVLWGVMATFLNFVPFLGAWTGTAIVGFVALLQFDTAWGILAPPIAFLALTSIEGNLITPLILGRSMSLDPFIVFLSLVVVGWMWGVMGAILAVPLLAIAKAVCEQFDGWRPVSLLIGGQSPREWNSERLTP